VIADGLTTDGTALGVEEGGALYIDKNGLATLSGEDAYIVLGDNQPEHIRRGDPLTYRDYKIWRLVSGDMFDFARRPTTGYYLRSVVNGVPDRDLY
jgi:cyanophycinase-like exopeptidase